MAKKVIEKVSYETKLADLNKKYSKSSAPKFIIPTGSIGLNKAYGGGYYSGRVYEKIAWEGSGKTTLCLHAAAEAQLMGLNPVYIDAENALDETYARKIGVDWDSLALFQPDCGEDGFDYAKEMISTGEVGLVIIDSSSGMLPRKVMEDPAGSSNMGLHARLMGTEIPKLVNLANTHGCVVIFVSQFREKIGVMFGSPETTQGGNALRFWASVRTEFRKGLNKEGDDVIGINTKFKTIKNKVVKPYQTGVVPITFGVGIDKTKEFIMLGKETEVLKERAGIITVVEHGTKFTEQEFSDLLANDKDFKYSLEKDIMNKYNPIININDEL